MPELSFYSIELIRNCFEKYLEGYSVNMFSYDEYSKIYVLNDSLVLLFEVNSHEITYLNYRGMKREDLTSNKYIEPGIYGNTAYSYRIVELTYNEIGFKYNNEKFKRTVASLIGEQFVYLPITFERFKGYTRLYWSPESPTDAERINEEIPELKLRERYDLWEGIPYNFIYLEFTTADNDVSKAVAYTTSKPDTYINMLCNKIVKYGKFSADFIRAGNDGYNWNLMQKSFNSWKGIRRVKRLEDNLKYFYIQEYYKENEDVWKRANMLVSEFYEHPEKFTSVERSSWLEPVNKWISEELTYKLTKQIYKEYQVIYQMRPFFLRSSISGGQLSYDVFISEINVAIEYQGLQHFQPVDFFGGEESFLKQVERDREKRELSEKNGIKLVYITYDDVITKELIKERVEATLLNDNYNHKL